MDAGRFVISQLISRQSYLRNSYFEKTAKTKAPFWPDGKKTNKKKTKLDDSRLVQRTTLLEKELEKQCHSHVLL